MLKQIVHYKANIEILEGDRDLKKNAMTEHMKQKLVPTLNDSPMNLYLYTTLSLEAFNIQEKRLLSSPQLAIFLGLFLGGILGLFIILLRDIFQSIKA